MIRQGRSWRTAAGTAAAAIAGAAVLGAATAHVPTVVSPPARAAHGPAVPQPGMGAPLSDLSTDQIDRFFAGKTLFRQVMEREDGVGPAMNRVRCSACHIDPLTGGSGTVKVTRFGREQDGVFDPLEALGGSLLQMQSINQECGEEIPPEANVVAQRITNGSFGYGLIEAIPDADLLALEQDPPGISGRAHIVEALEAPGVERVGRFGWKQLPTMLSFAGDAARNEMGFTNRLVPTEPDPNGVRPPHLFECDDVDDPEDGPDGEGFHFIDRVTDFQRFLGPPPTTPRDGMIGEAIFTDIGCAACHHPSFTTADDPELEAALRNKTISPYSDFLLHDVGTAGDGIVQGDASGTEFRTAPLWGLRARKMMWHDGRFDDLDFAVRVTRTIDLHGAEGSEAVAVHAAWSALDDDDKAALVRFLDSLGRREFDADGNELVTRNDFVAFVDCFTGPGEHYTPEDACSISDIDQDADVDVDDYASFMLVYAGPLDDCNENDVVDLDDILFGTSEDANRNGIPDECEGCRADVDDDGLVGFLDLIAILNAWGDCPALCPLDLDKSAHVDFGDIVVILDAWGPCE